MSGQLNDGAASQTTDLGAILPGPPGVVTWSTTDPPSLYAAGETESMRKIGDGERFLSRIQAVSAKFPA